MGNVLENVGKRIREIRKAKGYSQEVLGERCNFTFSYIGGVERAEKNISLLNLEKIANALDVELSELFIYTSDLDKLTKKNEELNKIFKLLQHRNPKQIKKAKIILTGLFDED